MLDTLEELSIEEDTVVFFSGDNGPDIPGHLFDDSVRRRNFWRALFFSLVHTQTEQLVIHQDRLGTDPIITQTLNGCVPLRHFALKLQGFFRGKKRSLHEGGVRQTIVVQWKGTIAPNSISDDLFIFYDLLPYAMR